MSDSNRKHLRRRIRSFKPGKASPEPAPLNAAAQILSGLNLLQTLEDNASTYLQDVLWYGPASFAGEGWASTLLWYRQKGLRTHATLTLFGVWAVTQDDDKPQLHVGTKRLAYSAPVFNLESYNQIIRRTFQTYYDDDGSPPPADSIFWSHAYDPTQRLALRRDLRAEIIRWMRRDHH